MHMVGAVQFLNGAACCSSLVPHFHLYITKLSLALTSSRYCFYAMVLLFEYVLYMLNHGNMYKHDNFLGADFKFRYTVELLI